MPIAYIRHGLIEFDFLGELNAKTLVGQKLISQNLTSKIFLATLYSISLHISNR